MTKEKLTALESKIRELVPSLMELSFGCRIYTKKWNNGFAPEVISGSIHGEFVKFECSLRSGTIHPAEITEIIGHPITLEAVLQACLEADSSIVWQGLDVHSNSLRFNIDGHFIVSYDTVLEIFWDIGKPLSSQPEETIDFLFNLFGL